MADNHASTIKEKPPENSEMLPPSNAQSQMDLTMSDNDTDISLSSETYRPAKRLSRSASTGKTYYDNSKERTVLTYQNQKFTKN